MKKILLLVIALAAGLTARAVWFTSAPASVNSGESYWVNAGEDAGSGIRQVWLYKNGAFIAYGTGNGYASAGSFTTDYGSQTVNYDANSSYWAWGEQFDEWAFASVTINPPPDVATTFSFSNLSHTYDGSTKTASVTPSPGGANYSADLTKGPGVGSYTVSATAYGGYTGSGSDTLTINTASVGFSLSATSFTYNGTAQGPSVVPSPGGATYSTGGTLSATSPGSYNATASAYGNYSGSNGALGWSISKATPTGTYANRSRGTQNPTTYTVQSGDLNASFAGPSGGATPTGTVTYNIISVTGSGASPTTGTVTTSTQFTVGVYTVRASYPGDSNYNSTTKDATWTITSDSDGDGILDFIEAQLGTNPNAANSTGAGTNELKIHRPN